MYEAQAVLADDFIKWVGDLEGVKASLLQTYCVELAKQPKLRKLTISEEVVNEIFKSDEALTEALVELSVVRIVNATETTVVSFSLLDSFSIENGEFKIVFHELCGAFGNLLQRVNNILEDLKEEEEADNE